MEMGSRDMIFSFVLCALAGSTPAGDAEEGLDLPRIRSEASPGLPNAGWAWDRYPELPRLDAGKRMVVADLEGPGIIRAIHTTRHSQRELSARGVVLEIYFDGSEDPAVLSPLADFFGDGCNGQAMNFSSKFIEPAPGSYNCYFPMPFRTRARVVLRNDLDRDLSNYSYVEWERLPGWEDDLGYFHATFQRKRFQLSVRSSETFLELSGKGHLLGRQYSIVTEEPMFRDFNWVMEGNNEVDIDGRVRCMDYLGTEDSFTFSWGFQGTFSGLRAGMALVRPEGPSMLSIYRFHDHMPIRFTKSLKWRIDWTKEGGFQNNAELEKANAVGGCWVDYATVHYWYQDSPAGYRHEPLPPIAERCRNVIPAPENLQKLKAAFEKLPLDPDPVNGFDAAKDLDRVAVLQAFPKTHPFWIGEPEAKGGHPGNPNPGRQGILAIHPQEDLVPCIVLRKVTLPGRGPSVLRVAISGDPYEMPGRSDFLLRLGVYADGKLRWLAGEEAIDAGTPPSEKNWRTVEAPLPAEMAGKTVGLVVQVAYGGPKGIGNEEAFIDRIEVAEPGGR
jgi:D-arabinan exo alpha-(1,3)/(1,5)-arabinofuranosidase (non-reducing end)